MNEKEFDAVLKSVVTTEDFLNLFRASKDKYLLMEELSLRGVVGYAFDRATGGPVTWTLDPNPEHPDKVEGVDVVSLTERLPDAKDLVLLERLPQFLFRLLKANRG